MTDDKNGKDKELLESISTLQTSERISKIENEHKEALAVKLESALNKHIEQRQNETISEASNRIESVFQQQMEQFKQVESVLIAHLSTLFESNYNKAITELKTRNSLLLRQITSMHNLAKNLVKNVDIWGSFTDVIFAGLVTIGPFYYEFVLDEASRSKEYIPVVYLLFVVILVVLRFFNKHMRNKEEKEMVKQITSLFESAKDYDSSLHEFSSTKNK